MDPLIERFMDREKKRKPKSYKPRRSIMRKLDEWMEKNDHTVETLDPLAVEDYLFELSAEGYTDKTVAAHYATLRLMFNTLVDTFGDLDKSPMDGLKMSDYTTDRARKREIADIVYATPEMVDLLCEHVPDPALRNETLIRTMFTLGLREGEVRHLRLSQLDLEARSARVRSLKTGNNQEPHRTVYWHDSEFDTILNLWLTSGRPGLPTAEGSPYVFVSRQGKKLGKGRINKTVREAAERAGIQEPLYVDVNGHERNMITSHFLRHGHAVHALKSGVDVRSVQKQMGHAKLSQTTDYLELIEGDVKDSYRAWV